jgi:hypothetical protein
VAILMGVAMVKSELNNTVHLCSNQGCTVDFILKPVYPALRSACVLAKVVVAKAKLNTPSRIPLYLKNVGHFPTVAGMTSLIL